MGLCHTVLAVADTDDWTLFSKLYPALPLRYKPNYAAFNIDVGKFVGTVNSGKLKVLKNSVPHYSGIAAV